MYSRHRIGDPANFPEARLWGLTVRQPEDTRICKEQSEGNDVQRGAL
jgi:hypothetical protein